MKSRNLWAVSVCVLLGAGRSLAQGHCATEPPPEGLVERCQSKVFYFPSGVSDSLRRAVFEVGLIEWMQTCVISDRAPGLVYGARDSVDHVFELIKDLPPLHPVTIVPEYTPLTYADEDGRTCYGVQSVSFTVPAAAGTVEPGEPDIVAGPTSDLIKEAAAAAIKALRDPSVGGSASLSRFLSVLAALESEGKDFDDTWYNVQPYPMALDFTHSIPPACFSDFEAGGGYVCRPDDEALKACERHLADDVADAYHFGHTPTDRFVEILQSKAEDIQRGIDYVAQVHGSTGGDIVACSSILEVFAPRMNAAAGTDSVYGRGGY